MTLTLNDINKVSTLFGFTAHELLAIKAGLHREGTRELFRRAVEAEARVREYESAINWGTTCLSCSHAIDASYQEWARANDLEMENDRQELAIKNLTFNVHAAGSDCLGPYYCTEHRLTDGRLIGDCLLPK
jgi:hypothetical protein